MSTETSDQFTNLKLVESYDSLNALGEDRDFWLSEIEKLSQTTIIDLGCGTGLLTCELAGMGYRMIGIEPAGPMLDVARRKNFADKVEWIEGGYEKFEGLKADLIIMTSHVAQFFYDDAEWSALLAASHKSLNPGGHMLFDSRQHIDQSFTSWPTSETRSRVEDPNAGPIEWWSNLLNVDGRYVEYELHYHFLNTGEEVVSTDKLIFRSEPELRTSIEAAGLTVKHIYGNWNGSIFDESSPEMLFLVSR